MKPTIVLIAHNLRSCHNVGSLLRTAEGLGIKTVYLTGYTPYPSKAKDSRLPHLKEKITKQINKTSLGAEMSIDWLQSEQIEPVLEKLHNQGYKICALEQTEDSIKLPGYKSPPKVAIIVGREVDGIEREILALADLAIEIPMFGHKESFNVVQAAAMALYQLRFNSGSKSMIK